ncbi:kinase-like domain-containing protein [Gilbertella persicaria]|uniref:kinase-like domain-containing protein n=1 Tax=Gilbertella persicaria TaxID=101096 RepID=UPI00222119E9|nr:kinase-like domain-containing protein [Gilbertella persicaria]KAI8092414.1 kinase-like domain-containing protein [Gilbertella persicaria]
MPCLQHSYPYLNTWIDQHSIQLISVLGVGAYGTVYLGRHVYSNQLFAIKQLINRKEADIHAFLSGHPNIIQFQKLVYTTEGIVWMVLEYQPEGDLFAAITRHKRDIVGDNDKIKHIFLQIIDAVDYCHQHKIAHRDLKPENITLGPGLQVKLTDFGLATTQSISYEFGYGSAFYFSPGKVKLNHAYLGS